jgi:hypothetical protein
VHDDANAPLLVKLTVPDGAVALPREEEMRQQIEERKANTPRGRGKREALVAAMELKDYEFNAHGLTLDSSSMSQPRSFRIDLKGLSRWWPSCPGRA